MLLPKIALWKYFDSLCLLQKNYCFGLNLYCLSSLDSNLHITCTWILQILVRVLDCSWRLQVMLFHFLLQLLKNEKEEGKDF